MAGLVISTRHRLSVYGRAAQLVRERTRVYTFCWSNRPVSFVDVPSFERVSRNYRGSIDASVSLKIRTAREREMVSREVPQRGMLCLFPFFFFFLFSRSFHVLPYLSRSEISPSSASSASQRGDKSASGAPRASIFFSLRNVPSPRERDRVPGFVGQFLLPWNFLSGIPVCTLYTRSKGGGERFCCCSCDSPAI